MPIKPISFGGGLVTSRHASLLNEGELTVAQDSRYRANDPALYRAWGRTRYISSNGQVGGAGGKIKGLAYCPFDPIADGASDDFLVAHRDDKYYTSVWTSRTGTISGTTIDAVGTGTHLDVCHANNKWYLFNGNTEGIANRVLKPGTTNPTSRRHGLVPVPHTPTSPSVTTSAGTWPTDDTFWGEGRFFFILTEVVNPGDGTGDELESAFEGTPPSVDLQKDANGNILFNVTITRPANLANSDATELRVYMAKTRLFQNWDTSMLASAFRVGSITPPSTTLVLSANYTFWDPANTPTVTVVSGTVSSASSAAAFDNVPATVTSSTAVIDLTNWGFAVSPGSASITGIRVWIRYRSTGLSSIRSQVRFGAGPTLSAFKDFRSFSDDYVFHVQPTVDSDNWGLTLTGTDANATTFGVRLTAIQNVQIDHVKMRVFTSNIPTIGPAYPIVAIQQGNVLVVQSANTPPPVASTGAVIDGCMVVNNVKNDREWAYSLPAKYDYFPQLYKIAIDSQEKDKTMVARKLGDIGLLFMRHQVIRLNYVPLSTDPEFNPGRAYEAIVPDHGCVSKQGVALFAIPGGPAMAAYVSHNGIYMNDAAHDHLMTEDLKWESLVDVTQLDKAVLLNYSKEHVLKFEYIGAGTGATENNRYLLIHYHTTHLKENKHFKITGPNIMRAACGTVAKLGAEHVLLLGHPTDARIYVEDNGVDDAEGTGINMLFESREIYPEGQGNQVTMVRAWYHHNGGGSGMTATSTQRYRNTEGALTDATAETFTVGTEGLVRLQHHLGLVEAIRFRLSIPDASPSNANIAFNHALYQYNDHGIAVGT